MRRLLFELQYLFSCPPWDTGVSPPELLNYLAHTPPGRALDLGCGTGTNSLTLARHGWDVLGIDFSYTAIRRARRKAKRAKLKSRFEHDDVSKLSGVEGPYDLALDIGCFHGLVPSARIRYAGRLSQLIRPGGDMLLYTFLEEGELEQPGLPSSARVKELFDAAFEILSIDYGVDRHHASASAWFRMRRSG